MYSRQPQNSSRDADNESGEPDTPSTGQYSHGSKEASATMNFAGDADNEPKDTDSQWTVQSFNVNQEASENEEVDRYGVCVPFKQ